MTAFLNADRLAQDVARINDAARSKRMSVFGVSLALLRNYNPFEAPTHFKLERPDGQVRQVLRHVEEVADRRYGKVTGDRTMADIEKRRAGSLELPVHRRNVVPGSVQLRFPPHRTVHHPLRHAGRRDFLLRVQHRRRLAQHHREDAHDRHPHQVVRGKRPA